MKRFTVLTVLVLTNTILFAQSIEITPTAGYTFSGDIEGYYGTYDLQNAFIYGAKLDVEIDDLSYFELSGHRNDPTLKYITSTGNARYLV